MSAIKTLGRLPASAFGALEIERLPEAVLAGYRALGDLTGTTSDAMDYCGVSGAVPGSSLRPSDPAARVVAQAVSVRSASAMTRCLIRIGASYPVMEE